MKTNIGRRLALRSALVSMLVLGGPAQAQVIELKDIQPACTEPFKVNAANTVCEITPEALKARTTAAECSGPGLSFTPTKDTTGKTLDAGDCKLDVKTKPKPSCGTALPDLAVKEGRCVVDRQVPRSANADYIGDRFEVVAVTKENPAGLKVGTRMMVLSQRAVGTNDRELVVALCDDAKSMRRCRLGDDAVASKVLASQLVEVAASRYGWTFGVLALPYKFHTSDKSFSSNVSVGPYLGRRWSRAGSAITPALAATIGQVKVKVVDDSGKLLDTVDLQAFSLAVGVMWDIAKNTETKPFKVGLFLGRDWVGKSDVLKYDFKHKRWLAFQIGYDFTDN